MDFSCKKNRNFTFLNNHLLFPTIHSVYKEVSVKFSLVFMKETEFLHMAYTVYAAYINTNTHFILSLQIFVTH